MHTLVRRAWKQKYLFSKCMGHGKIHTPLCSANNSLKAVLKNVIFCLTADSMAPGIKTFILPSGIYEGARSLGPFFFLNSSDLSKMLWLASDRYPWNSGLVVQVRHISQRVLKSLQAQNESDCKGHHLLPQSSFWVHRLRSWQFPHAKCPPIESLLP